MEVFDVHPLDSARHRALTLDAARLGIVIVAIVIPEVAARGARGARGCGLSSAPQPYIESAIAGRHQGTTPLLLAPRAATHWRRLIVANRLYSGVLLPC